MVVKRSSFEARIPGFESQFHTLLVWASYLISVCWFLSLENNNTYIKELICKLNEISHVKILSTVPNTEFSINVIFTIKHLLSTCFLPGPVLGAGTTKVGQSHDPINQYNAESPVLHLLS